MKTNSYKTSIISQARVQEARFWLAAPIEFLLVRLALKAVRSLY